MILASGNKSDMRASFQMHNLLKLGIYKSASVELTREKENGVKTVVS